MLAFTVPGLILAVIGAVVSAISGTPRWEVYVPLIAALLAIDIPFWVIRR